MARQYDFTGQSGTQYRYKSLEDLRPVSPGGANYLYVKWQGDIATIIYCGETDSLHRAVFESWEEAKAAHGATEILARLNITGAVRRAEQADLIGKHRPAMNPPPAGARSAPKAVKAKAEKAAGEPDGDDAGLEIPPKKAPRKTG
ncbi:MAG: hypothetical protein KA105_06340 [Caulobacter sp.]|nr:hypothetical protein [Caulobacter sp.]